jgi:hypothetical protein
MLLLCKVVPSCAVIEVTNKIPGLIARTKNNLGESQNLLQLALSCDQHDRIVLKHIGRNLSAFWYLCHSAIS